MENALGEMQFDYIQLLVESLTKLILFDINSQWWHQPCVVLEFCMTGELEGLLFYVPYL